MRIEDLSVNERIIIHLRDFGTDPVNEGASLGQTQEGIGEGVGIRINHVPRATNSLLAEGYIGEALVHIGGLKRRRKAFFLTAKGLEAADGLISDLKAQKVPFRDSGGGEIMLGIEDILFKSRHARVPALILSYFRDGVLLEASLAGATEQAFVSVLDSIAEPDVFVDRAQETTILKKWLDRGETLIVISGMKGMGKTSLVRMVLGDYEGRKNILWHSAHDWDTGRGFLEQVSEMYVRLGRNEVRKLLKQTRDLDISQASSALIRDILGSDSFLVIDNVFDLRRDVMQLLHMLCERSRELQNSCIIMITRDMELTERLLPAGGPGYRSMVLKGLERGSAMELMESMGLDREDGDRVYAMTQGHPLAIRLVNSDEIKNLIDAKGLTKEEIWVVRCMKAFDAIFKE